MSSLGAHDLLPGSRDLFLPFTAFRLNPVFPILFLFSVLFTKPLLRAGIFHRDGGRFRLNPDFCLPCLSHSQQSPRKVAHLGAQVMLLYNAGCRTSIVLNATLYDNEGKRTPELMAPKRRDELLKVFAERKRSRAGSEREMKNWVMSPDFCMMMMMAEVGLFFGHWARLDF